jgi:hypothetical protein
VDSESGYVRAVADRSLRRHCFRREGSASGIGRGSRWLVGMADGCLAAAVGLTFGELLARSALRVCSVRPLSMLCPDGGKGRLFRLSGQRNQEVPAVGAQRH